MASFITQFTGDGSTKAFTASFPVLRTTDLAVVVNNVWLNLGLDYYVSGPTTAPVANLLTAPANGATVTLRSAVGYTPMDPAAGSVPVPHLTDTDTSLFGRIYDVFSLEAAARAAADAAIIASGDEPANVSLATVIASGATQARPVIEYLSERISVANFGAYPTTKSGYETTDTSTAFQAAFDAAAEVANATGDGWPGGVEVVIPAGTYYWDSPVTLAAEAASATPPLKSNRMSVNVRGLGGSDAVNIVYRGTGGTALTVTNNIHFTIENLHLRDEGTGAVGIAIKSSGAGSSTGQGRFKQVHVLNFDTGIQIGSTDDRAASELHFDYLGLSENGVGVRVLGITSVNLWFDHMNGVGSGPQILVDRENATTPPYNETTIALSVTNSSFGFSETYEDGGPLLWFKTFGTYNLRGCYCELEDVGFLVRTGPETPVPANAGQEILPTVLNMDSCTLIAASGERSEFNAGGAYVVKGCVDYGYKLGGRAVGDKGALTVIGSQISATEPVTYKTGCGVTWNVNLIGNSFAANNNQSVHDDEHFIYLSDGTKRVLQSFAWSDAYNEVDEEVPRFAQGLAVDKPIETAVALAVSPANGAAYSPNLGDARSWEFTAGSGVSSFTIGAITPQVVGSRLRIRLKNTSGGALSVSWHSMYKIPTWVNLANGKSRTYDFENSPINVCTCTSVGPDVDN